MATKVDELIVEFGLDPRRFTQGQRETVASLRTLEREALRAGRTAENAGTKMAEAFRQLKVQALGFVGAVVGARGISEFIQRVVSLDASTGRMARTMNMSTKELSIWQNMAKASGSSAEEMTGTMQGLTDELNKLAVGIPSNILPAMTALNVSWRNNNGGLKTAAELLMDFAGAVERTGAAEARVKLLQVGIPTNVINMLLEGRTALQGLHDDMEKLGGTTEEASRQAQQFQRVWGQLSTEAFDIGRRLFNAISPGVNYFLIGMRALIGMAQGKPSAEIDKEAREAKERFEKSRQAPGTSSVTGAAIPLKPGAGIASGGVQTALDNLKGVGGIREVTAMNDAFHLRRGGAHPAGRAFDLSVVNPRDAEAVAAAIRERLEARGIAAKVVNEYDPRFRSAGATGGHIHVSLGAAAGATAPLGASAAATGRDVVSNANDNRRTLNVTNNINGMSNPSEVAAAVQGSLDRSRGVAAFNAGY